MAASKSTAAESGGADPQRSAAEKSNSPVTKRKQSMSAAKKPPLATNDAQAREQSEEDLRESHEELQAIYDGMFDGLLVADHDTKKFLRANPAICEMLGYSEDELLKMSVMHIHPPDVLPQVLDQFDALAEGRASLAEGIPFQCKDGSVFYADVAVRANDITYRGRPCAIGFIRNVTERKRAEEALRKERDFSTSLLQASPTFFVAIGAQGQTLIDERGDADDTWILERRDCGNELPRGFCSGV